MQSQQLPQKVHQEVAGHAAAEAGRREGEGQVRGVSDLQD